ncbi:MAG: CRISPR-associated protein Csx3 [bacterium]
MSTYNINLVDGILKVGFGSPAQNDHLVKDAKSRLDEMVASKELTGGPVIKINGPASLPVAMVLTHGLAHLYEVVAGFDPKLGKYVVATSHGSTHQVGDLID